MSTPWEKEKKDECIKMWYVGTMDYYSLIKEQNEVICRDVDGPRVCLNTVKSDREK